MSLARTLLRKDSGNLPIQRGRWLRNICTDVIDFDKQCGREQSIKQLQPILTTVAFRHQKMLLLPSCRMLEVKPQDLTGSPPKLLERLPPSSPLFFAPNLCSSSERWVAISPLCSYKKKTNKYTLKRLCMQTAISR